MSKFTVNLEEESKNEASAPNNQTAAPLLGEVTPPKKKRGCLRIFGVLAAIFAVIALIAAVGGYFYWQSLKKTPQYSLALLVDAARNNDQKTIDTLVDTNAVVDDFMPQITTKAVELYGKGLPPQMIARVAQAAAPVLPAIKERARAELPALIRDQTESLANVPFAAVVLSASRYLDITQNGETATIKSKIQDQPLELTMKKNGDRWQVIAIKDDRLATKIAQKIGQEIIAVATKGGINKAGESLGIKNLQDLLKQTNDILK